MRKTLKKLFDQYSFWFTFIFGATIGVAIILRMGNSQICAQTGAGFSKIFANNLKVALLIMITGIFTNMIIPFIILFLNGIFWGSILTTNLCVVGPLTTLLFCLHVPFELLDFRYSFSLSSALHQVIFCNPKKQQYVKETHSKCPLHMKDIFENCFWMIVFLLIAAIIESFEFHFFRK